MPTGRSSGPLFFFNDTATTEIYTLSLHDALPIYRQVLLERGARGLDPAAVPRRHRVRAGLGGHRAGGVPGGDEDVLPHRRADRKSTRLNSSHANISYAVFCLKKKKHYIPLEQP